MCEGWENLAGKFMVVARLMEKLRKETDDRIVIVSNYTATLELFSQLCHQKQVRVPQGLPTVQRQSTHTCLPIP